MAAAQGEQTPEEATPSGDEKSTAASRVAAKRAAKAAEKAKKRAATPVPADVAETVVAAKSWFDEHARLIYGGLGAFLLIGGGLVAAQHFMSQDLAGKVEVLNETVELANAPIIPEGEEPPEGVDESFPSAKARADKVLAQARSAQKAGSETSKRWAALVEANAQAQLGKHAEARKVYDALLAAGDALPGVLRYRALEGRGFALEAEQKYAEAAKSFEQIGALEGGAFKLAGEYHRARMLIAQGERKKAADVLDALLKAERSRPATEPKRFEDTVSAAETALDELAVELDDPKLRSASEGAAAGGDIMQMIRSQLQQGGKGDPTLDEKALQKLVQELDQTGSAPAEGTPK